MKIDKLMTLAALLLLLCVISGCGQRTRQTEADKTAGKVKKADTETENIIEEEPEEPVTLCSENAVKSIYYWKTVFNLTDWDKDFLAKHDIKRIYLRLFDVGYDRDLGEEREESAIPIATVQFESGIPEGIEIVPVVYITTKAISRDPDFSDKLYLRVKKMAKKNGFKDFRELQLDCDWTKYTAEEFFGLCEKMRDKLHADGRELSATIRLHQLKKEVPPVDRGVLMVYNTGSLYSNHTKNSILYYDDVEPYLKSNVSYDLTLSCAFPLYSWGILLDKNGNFKSILHTTDYSDRSLYELISKETLVYNPKTNSYELSSARKYKVLQPHYIEGNYAWKDDIIRIEKPSYNEINDVKRLVASKIESEMDGVVLYHLDSHEISRFTSNEIDAILK